MRKAIVILIFALILLAGCASKGSKQTPQEAIDEIRTSPQQNYVVVSDEAQRAYDMAQLECQALATQIVGPRGSFLTQAYYEVKCMRAKGFAQ